MTPTLSRLLTCLTFTFACCCISGASAALADGIAAEPNLFLIPPQLSGWNTAPRDPDDRWPRLSSVHLQSEDGAVDVDISIHVLAFGRQAEDHVGAIPVAEWLPKNTRWLTIGQNDRQCFWQDALSSSGSPQRQFSGQARCRHSNFVLIFNLFSRRDRRRSEATWKKAFADIVVGTKTRVRCLDPEEMTFLADYEGPPFVRQSVDSNTVIVAAAPMCGSGGCRCFRYEKKATCFQLVLPPYGCDDELRPFSGSSLPYPLYAGSNFSCSRRHELSCLSRTAVGRG